MTTAEMTTAEYKQENQQKWNQEWVRRMGPYTDRTLEDVWENVYVNWNDKSKRKTLTLNERYILWKIKELNWERLIAYHPINNDRNFTTSANPYCIARKHYNEIDPETGESADTGMTFDAWVKYRKDHKIRTFL
jgi:hypothetical protein